MCPLVLCGRWGRGQTVDAAGGVWVEQVILSAPDGQVGDRFGDSIDIHRIQVVIGAPGANAQVGCTCGQ